MTCIGSSVLRATVLKIPMPLLAVMACLAVLLPSSVAKAEIVVHRRDSVPIPGDRAQLFDSNVGGLITDLSYAGTFGDPNGYFLQSLDYDATTGILYGLVRAYSVGQRARVLSWNPGGILLSDRELIGYPADTYDRGMDMSVHDGVVAVHRSDSLRLPTDAAQLYDASTGGLITSLSYAGTVGDPNRYYLQSLDYDAVTGRLSGLVRDTLNGNRARVLTWSSSGGLLDDVELIGYPGENLNYGGDLAVHDRVVALHRRDVDPLTADRPQLFDVHTGLQLADLSLAGTFHNPNSYYLQSLDFDAGTGNLSGLVQDVSDHRVRVLTWDSGGALLSDVLLSGYPGDALNGGGDLAVFTLVPEPSTVLLAAFGFAALGAFGCRRRKLLKPRPVPHRSGLDSRLSQLYDGRWPSGTARSISEKSGSGISADDRACLPTGASGNWHAVGALRLARRELAGPGHRPGIFRAARATDSRRAMLSMP